MKVNQFGHLKCVRRRALIRSVVRDVVVRAVSIRGLGGQVITRLGGIGSKPLTNENALVVKKPSHLGRKIVCFAHYDINGSVSEADRDALAKYRLAGYQVCLVSTASSLPDGALNLVDAVIMRQNKGYDFASWSAFVKEFLPREKRINVDHLVLTNNSMYGPLWDVAPLLSRAAKSANVVGLTLSREFAPHLQSYFLSFDAKALSSDAFESFWSRGYSSKRKWGVIANGELIWGGFFEKAGLTTQHLIPRQANISRNELTFFWSALVSAGLPFVKKSLFKSNYDDVNLGNWQQTIAAYAPEYDVKLIERDIAV